MGGKSELVRSSVRVGAVQGQTADNKEETKDPSAAVLLKSKIEGEDIALEDFKIKKVLDKGSFGKVFLVVNQKNG